MNKRGPCQRRKKKILGEYVARVHNRKPITEERTDLRTKRTLTPEGRARKRARKKREQYTKKARLYAR